VKRAVALLAIGLIAAGCGDSEERAGASAQPTVGPTGGGEPVAEPPASTPDEVAREREAKRTWREPGSTEVSAIDWSAASTRPRVDPAVLPEAARALLPHITLPVLLPPDPAMLRGAVLTRGETWYAASLHPEGHHVAIHGSRLAVHHPDLANSIPEDRRRRPGEPELTRTHGIVSVSFDVFGASYVLDVECAAPTTDTRCTEDAYALSVFEGLGVAGGAE